MWILGEVLVRTHLIIVGVAIMYVVRREMRSRIRQGPRRERLLMVATGMSLLMVVILLTMLLLLIGLMLIFITHI